MMYEIMKLVHVLATIIFLGTITLGLFWKRYAEKKKDQKVIADTFGGIIKADRMLTMPAVAFLIIFGFGAQGIGRIPIETGWILWSIILLVISSAAFMAKVVPTQKKIYALASSKDFTWEKYQKLAKEWELWGFIALITPWIAVALMVLKRPL